ncbi:MAG TPA: hypothetical protein VK896_01590 [Gaiellaceae bacterium]|nr:hypothetical protein [Gaiellaceae bacterium]
MNRKLTAALFVVAALSVVAAPQALAGGGKKPAKNAAKATCKAERAALGTRLFRATYGATPVATCRRRVLDEAQEAVGNAAQECFAERAADADAFREKYGQNANKRNAFGKCVSTLAKKELAEEVLETLNAAKECKAERAEDPDAFREKYGTNANKSNAFGKCVSGKKAAEPGEEAPGEGEGEGEGDPGEGGGAEV